MKKKPNSKYKAAGVVILILLLAAAAFFIFKSCSAKPDGDTGSAALVYDSGAVEGGWDEASTSEIVASLNQQVEEGTINISMNTSPCKDLQSREIRLCSGHGCFCH
jgi:hypothetical protein